MSLNGEGQIVARHYATGERIQLSWEKGIITSIRSSDTSSNCEQWIAPALFDLQINGYAGVDFQRDDLTVEQLLHVTKTLRRDGCSRFLLTLITDSWPRLTARLRGIKELREQSPELKWSIAGWHVEGPFLSAAPGFCGAHNPAVMIDPTAAHVSELREITGSDPLMITLAPERSGALNAISEACLAKFRVSLGHTNAPFNVLADAVKAGAIAFTHLGNGCPRELDRHDNILWRVFELPGITVTLIPDSVHISPELFRLVHRIVEPKRIVYVSDAMSAAGMPAGRYRLGQMELEVGDDQVVRQPGKPLFAGSALRPIDGIHRASAMLQTEWREVWSRYSTSPAVLMGLTNEISTGQAVNFCVFKVNPSGKILELKTIVPSTHDG